MSRLGTEGMINQDSISHRDRYFCLYHYIKSASVPHCESRN